MTIEQLQPFLPYVFGSGGLLAIVGTWWAALRKASADNAKAQLEAKAQQLANDAAIRSEIREEHSRMRQELRDEIKRQDEIITRQDGEITQLRQELEGERDRTAAERHRYSELLAQYEALRANHDALQRRMEEMDDELRQWRAGVRRPGRAGIVPVFERKNDRHTETGT